MNDSHDELSPPLPSTQVDGGQVSSETAEALLDEIDTAIHRMGRLMGARHAEFQHASGMATPHFMLLKMIACEGPTRVSDLASLLGVKNPAASMIVQQLEGDGLIERRHDEKDNRVVIVSMTDVGRSRLAGAEVFRRELLRRMTCDLSVDDLSALLRMLGTIGDSVARRT